MCGGVGVSGVRGGVGVSLCVWGVYGGGLQTNVLP